MLRRASRHKLVSEFLVRGVGFFGSFFFFEARLVNGHVDCWGSPVGCRSLFHAILIRVCMKSEQVFLENQVVNVVRFHPSEENLFIAGGSKGSVKLWDIRLGSSVCEYSKLLGQVMDVDFSPDGTRFVTTSDIAKRNSSDKSLVVWNFAKQIPLSNQVSTRSRCSLLFIS